MVNLKVFSGRANGTPAILAAEQKKDVVCRETAAIASGFGAACRGAGPSEFLAALWIGCLPAISYLTRLFAIIFVPAFCFGPMPCRVFGAATARAGRFATRIFLSPSFRTAHRTLNTLATCDEKLVFVPILTRFLLCKMPLSGCASRDTGRMFWLLGLAAHGGFGLACRTAIADYISLRHVTAAARFTSCVKRLAGRDGGVSLRTAFHGNPLGMSDILIVVGAARKVN